MNQEDTDISFPEELSISFILPVYNEEGNIDHIYQEIADHMASHHAIYSYEIIFADDGSTDESWNHIVALAQKDARVKGISLTKNFGKEKAMTVGLEYAAGRGMIMIDADGQRPVSVISEFFRHWEAGYPVVYGIRTEMQGGMMRRFSSHLFNAIMSMISDVHFERGVTDFMLIDRKLLPYLQKYTHHNRLFRSMVFSLGFPRQGVEFVESPRFSGRQGWSIGGLWMLALNSIISSSTLPLRILSILGGILALGAIILAILTVMHLLNASLLVLLWSILIVLLSLSVSIGALYLSRLHRECMSGPLFVIDKTVNV